MKIKDLTDNYGHKLYPYLLKSSECDPEQELKIGDMVLLESIQNGRIKRYAKITKGDRPTSWRSVTIKREDQE
jgi:hypothetical protein